VYCPAVSDHVLRGKRNDSFRPRGQEKRRGKTFYRPRLRTRGDNFNREDGYRLRKAWLHFFPFISAIQPPSSNNRRISPMNTYKVEATHFIIASHSINVSNKKTFSSYLLLTTWSSYHVVAKTLFITSPQHAVARNSSIIRSDHGVAETCFTAFSSRPPGLKKMFNTSFHQPHGCSPLARNPLLRYAQSCLHLHSWSTAGPPKILTLKMATIAVAKTLKDLQHSTRIISESGSYKLNTSSENLRTRKLLGVRGGYIK
jgi:hypothetical protein